MKSMYFNEYFNSMTNHKGNDELESFDVLEAGFTGGNISMFELVLIIQTCKIMNPMKILELGTFNGRTSLNMALNTHRDTAIITVDLPDLESAKYSLESEEGLDESGYVGMTEKLFLKREYDEWSSKISQFWIDSAQFPFDSFLNDKFDLIFIDASHSYENALNDSLNCMKVVGKNGLIMWHDYGGWPGVTKALDELNSEYKDIVHIKGTSIAFYFSK